jgi:rhamnose transport system substrate-binding protein
MKNLVKKALALSVGMAALCSAIVLAGCQKKTTGIDSTTYAVVFKNTGNPAGDRYMGGFEDGIKEQGYTAILRAPDLPTAEAQIPVIEQLIAQRVAAICIAASDYDALQPVLIRAKNAGIKVISFDSGVNPASRLLHVNQATFEAIGETLAEAAFDMADGSGEIAILSSTSQASNQNAWNAAMQEVMKQPKYTNLKIVKIAYGDDLRDKSTSETEGLLASYPNLKVIVSPTTVGIAAAAKVVSDRGLIGKVKIAGLGLPSEMAEYINNGACPYMHLWNPIDTGYLGSYAVTALVSGKITGEAGEAFDAGRLGAFTITGASDGGTEVILGPPFKFDLSNINEWKDVF